MGLPWVERNGRRVTGGFFSRGPQDLAGRLVQRHAGGSGVDDEQLSFDQGRAGKTPVRSFHTQFRVDIL